ncbi:Lipid A export ATP-binding/permease protein MsbA [Clostridiaceae bacterium JG1575]|nr:Lipid A export ATP-binding/permease protein MsbA [Clostridiaceae bacterium JG1575]
MKLLLSEMKRYWVLVLCILAALFVQAYSELSLPDYMARIVNVGISQNGLEKGSPLALSEKTLTHMRLVVPENEAKTLEGAYLKDAKLLKALRQRKGFSSLQEDALVLDPMKAQDEALSVLTQKSLMLVAALSMPAEPKGPGGGLLPAPLPRGDAAFQALAQMPPAQKKALLERLEKTFESLPESMCTAGAMTLLGREYQALGVDQGKLQNDYIFGVGLRMLGIAFLALLASLIVGFIASRIAADVGRSLRNRFFQKVLSFSGAELDRFSTASLITRSNNDIQQVQNMLVMLLRMLFFAPIMGIGGLIKALSTNASMAWIIALAVLVILIVVITVFSLAMPLFQRVQKQLDGLNKITREILNGLLVIRAFVTGRHEEKRFDRANERLTKTNQRIATIMISLNPLLLLMLNGVMILIVWVGAHQISQGTMQVGDMMAFMQYAMLIIMSFLMISMVSILLPRAQISLKRLEEVLNTDASLVDAPDATPLPQEIEGTVEFHDVSFRFHDAPADVVEHICLKIPAGKTTAIVGSTGSGKSTLVNLIPRFYDVTAGAITIDGRDIRHLPMADLRRHIGFIPQTASLFSGTIASNLRIGKNADLSENALEEALQVAQAKSFVAELPLGLQAPTTQGGTNLSGGQKQRLSIARAIAGPAEILIFDDSFSALDFQTDLALRRALAQRAKAATIIVVAQRIGTIINADNIVVLDQGRLICQGTHKELMEGCEIYQQIAASQIRTQA